MRRTRSLIAALAAAGTVAAGGGLTCAPIGSAANDTAVKAIPVNDSPDQLEMHVFLDCPVADGRCNFNAGAHLLTPEGPQGFPKGLWARQSTEVRSMDRSVYLDVHTPGGTADHWDRGGPGVKVFKESGWAVITSIFRNEGPPEKYQTVGVIDANDQATGQFRPDVKVIVCSHMQVVYSGVNVTSPPTCAQAAFS